jgi:hypothetical protein
MMSGVVVPALEQRILLIAASHDVGHKIDDLVTRELLEQTLGHD